MNWAWKMPTHPKEHAPDSSRENLRELDCQAPSSTTTGIMRQFDSSGTRRHSVLWKTLALDMIQALNSNFRKPCV